MKEILLGKSYVLAAAAPTLSEFKTWFTTEVQIGIGIIVVCLILFLWLVKQQIGKALGVLAGAAFTFFLINDPTKVLNSFGEIFNKIFK